METQDFASPSRRSYLNATNRDAKFLRLYRACLKPKNYTTIVEIDAGGGGATGAQVAAVEGVQT